MNIPDELMKFLPDDSGERYNTALLAAQRGNYDMAYIQLKTLTDEMPLYGDAVKLFALLCIEKKDYARACRALNTLIEADPEDEQAKRYMKEASSKGGFALNSKIARQEIRDRRQEQDVLIPTYSEKSELLHDFLRLAAGIIIGVVAAWFLLLPSYRDQLIADSNKEIKAYNDNLSAKELEISSSKQQIEDLTGQLEDTQKALAEYTDKGGFVDAYKSLVLAMEYYVNEDYLKASKNLRKIDKDKLNDSTFVKAYSSLENMLSTNAVDELYKQGLDFYRARDFDSAIDCLKEMLRLDKDSIKGIYWLGMSYYFKGDTENASIYFYQLQREYPNTGYADAARRWMPLDTSAENGDNTGENTGNDTGDEGNPAGGDD